MKHKIIKWENKPFKDFKMPEGYRLAEFDEFCKLINSKKIKPKKWELFITKNPLKNKVYPLFRAYLNNVGGWCAYDDNLSFSNDLGRVVIIKEELV